MNGSRTFVALLFLVLSGCGEPTIEASSNASFEASAAAIEGDLPPIEAAQFRRALRVVLMEGVRISLDNSHMEQIAKNQERIDGYDASEVIALAGEIRSD